MITSLEYSQFIQVTNFIGIIAFAISGYFKAQKYNLDLFGALILGIIVSVGGGLTRDVILNITPSMFVNSNDIKIAVITVLVLFTYFKLFDIQKSYLQKYKSRIVNLVKVSDAIGLAIFTIIGANLGLKYYNTLFPIIFFGVITGVGGGIYRDLLVNEIPFILKEDIYASLCLVGSVMIYAFNKMHFNEIYSSIFVFFFILIIRLIVIVLKLNLPNTFRKSYDWN